MKRFSLISLAAATVAVPLAYQGNVLLQDDTPGTTQAGHINVNGTVKGGQFIANSTAPTGQVIAGDFRTASNEGRGILGNASSLTGATYGGLFQSASNGGRGIAGFSTAADGTTYGGFFGNTSIKGRGVYGQATAASGTTYGVYGKAVSPDGFGVFSEGNMSATGIISGNGSGLTGVAPSGPAGGVLSGSFPNPGLVNGTVTAAKLAQDFEGLLRVTGGVARITGTETMAIGIPSVEALAKGVNILESNSLALFNDSHEKQIQMQVLVNKHPYLFQLNPSGAIIATMSGQETNGVFRGAMDIRDDNGVTQASLNIDATGKGVVAADIKNFKIPNPDDPRTDIWYASLEGPEAAVYLRGTAHLKDGRAFIPFPDHFRAVATADGMTVSLTPRSLDTYGLAVIDQSLDGITVGELKKGAGSFDFDWRVEAIRRDHQDYRVIRPWDEMLGDELPRDKQWKARLKSIASRQLRPSPKTK